MIKRTLYLFVAALGYITHSVATVVLGDVRTVLFERMAMVARAGELPIMLWLLIKGANVRALGQTAAAPSP